jgi:hypothetical protein
MAHAPTVTGMRIIPVAGHDRMLLNLSGAPGPFFIRNVVILTDSWATNSTCRASRRHTSCIWVSVKGRETPPPRCSS